MSPHALLVDDEPDILALLEMTLDQMGIRSTPTGTLTDARRLLDLREFDLCLTDMRLPDGNGIDLVRHAARTRPTLPVAVITAYGNTESAVEAMKAGAFDFVSKPVKLPNLRRLVETALRARRHPHVSRRSGGPSERELLGASEAMSRVRQLIVKLARTQAPVFITGESGTGKELAARLIHEQGPRAQGAFVAVNCGAIPHELMESELFGHRKGSFTGAIADKAGLFQAADGGTLFLDEIGDLPLGLQVKLLRAIQEKAIRPVGAEREVPVDARIISASHKNLRQLVDKGTFRDDLYYRINVIELAMPPLRQRPEDIEIIAGRLIATLPEAPGRGALTLSADALAALRTHPFPGNVRELENVLQRAAALCEGNVIRPADLALPEISPPAPGLSAGSEPPLENQLEEIEKRSILEALEQTRWNRAEAARRLGLTPRSLRYRLRKYGLD